MMDGIKKKPIMDGKKAKTFAKNKIFFFKQKTAYEITR